MKVEEKPGEGERPGVFWFLRLPFASLNVFSMGFWFAASLSLFHSHSCVKYRSGISIVQVHWGGTFFFFCTVIRNFKEGMEGQLLHRVYDFLFFFFPFSFFILFYFLNGQ